jgi:hypothetical protein
MRWRRYRRPALSPVHEALLFCYSFFEGVGNFEGVGIVLQSRGRVYFYRN